MKLDKPLILASGSPRRRELLSRAGFCYTVQTGCGEEKTSRTRPSDIVCDLSLQKATEIATAATAPCYVIGADTMVAYEDHILGKPKSAAQAKEMIALLQGRIHQVYTGVTLAEVRDNLPGRDKSFRGPLPGSGLFLRTRTFFERTDVSVCPMTDEEIQDYVETGEPMDKAGGYGIQGAFCVYVEGIRGDYFNVVGLPLSRLCREMKAFLTAPI